MMMAVGVVMPMVVRVFMHVVGTHLAARIGDNTQHMLKLNRGVVNA